MLQLPIRFIMTRVGKLYFLTYHVRSGIPTPVAMRYIVSYEMSVEYPEKKTCCLHLYG